jgi:hypothetical protein
MHVDPAAANWSMLRRGFSTCSPSSPGAGGSSTPGQGRRGHGEHGKGRESQHVRQGRAVQIKSPSSADVATESLSRLTCLVATGSGRASCAAADGERSCVGVADTGSGRAAARRASSSSKQRSPNSSRSALSIRTRSAANCRSSLRQSGSPRRNQRITTRDQNSMWRVAS